MATPGGFFPILRRWAVVVAVATGVALLVGYVLAQRATPTYQARADLLVGPLDADRATVRAATAAIGTYAQLGEAPATLDAVARATGLDRGQLRSGVRVRSDPVARILTVRARASTPEAAAAAANGVADHLVSLAADDAPTPSGRIQIIDVAAPSSSPIRPGIEAITALAAVAGLLGGLALVMVLELVGDPAGSATDIRRATRVPVLCLPVAGYRPGGVRSGEVVATQLALVRPGIRSVLFTGTSTFDGGGRLALELAAAWVVGSGGRVVVVDAGAGETTVVMGVDGRAGVSEALAGAAVDPTPLGGGVEVLGGRDAADGPIDALAPGRVVEDLVAGGAAVVVHAPPLAAATATLAWARAVDTTVLVSRRGTGRRRPLAQAAEVLRRVGADLALTVLHARGRPTAPWGRSGRPRRSLVAMTAGLALVVSACSPSSGQGEAPSSTPRAPSDGGSDRDEHALPPLGGPLEGLTALDRPPDARVAGRLATVADEAREVEPSAREPLLITDTEDVFVGDAQRAWTLALAYRVLRRPADARAAAAIVEDWLSTTETIEDACPRSGGCSTSLMVSRAAPGFVFAAEVLQSEGFWDGDRTEAFHTWLREVILPAASDRDGNWGDAGTFLRVAVAIELDDGEELERAAERWQERIDLIESDGQIPEEVRREDAGLMYSQEALGYKVATADMLARAGIDVWDRVGARGGSLRSALDLVARSLDRPEAWPVSTDDLRIPRPAPLWSIAAARWDDAAYEALAAAARGRDGSGHSAVLWTSVTHPG